MSNEQRKGAQQEHGKGNQHQEGNKQNRAPAAIGPNRQRVTRTSVSKVWEAKASR